MTTHTGYGSEPNVPLSTTSPPVTEVAYVESIKRISWAAIFAGVILALVIQLLLSMLGTGLGMSIVDPVEGETPSAEALSVSAGVWWILSGLIALFTAGWIAAHLAGIPRQVDGMIHGLLTWSLSTLLMLLFIGTALGALIGGTLNAAQAPRQAAQDAAKNPALSGQELNSLLDRLIRQGQTVASEVDREAVINVLVARTDMSRDEAARTVDNWMKTYQQNKETISKSSIWGFIALLIGAAAAAIGGIIGAPRTPVVVSPPSAAR